MKRIVYLADASNIHTHRWVAHFAQSGYETHVFSFLPGEIPGASIHWLRAGPVKEKGGNWRYFMHLADLRRQIHQLQPDLLHAHYLTSYGLLGALVGIQPLILTAWGSDVLVTPRRSRLYRLLLRYTLAKADLVTSDAETMSQEILQFGLKRDRLLTVPLGVNLSTFHLGGRVWPEYGNRLINTRHLVPNNNLGTVLRAMARAREEGENLSLRVVGNGPERPRLEGVAVHLGVNQNVTWLGLVDHSELPSYLQEADLFLSLTKSDSTSVSLLEAMACGALPIVSDLPANREWIEPGLNGFLVAHQDVEAVAAAIVQAVGDLPLRRNAAEYNVARIAERANWERNMDTIEMAYQALMTGRNIA